ncbi:glycosyltransferase, partial [Kineococcus sp. R8]|uniref:glycosyltransferase n=1 Tax=Kineococcus siccus TaxID=2696567 RepID=UPI001412EED2
PKVMLVPNAYPPSSRGGVETYVTLLAAELTAQGLHPLVLHPYRDLTVPDYDQQLDVVDGVDVLRVNRPENLWHQEFGDPRFERLFAEAIREHGVDVVHFHHLCDGLSPSLVEVARNAGARTVVTLHDGYVSCAKGHAVDAAGKPCSGAESVDKCVSCLGGGPHAPGPVRLQLTQRAEVRNRVMADALGQADLVTAPSRYIADLTRRAPWAASIPIEVRPLGLDLESFRGARTPARRRRPGDRLRVVVMGNVRVHPSGTDTKGGLLVATAAQALPALDVHVHGGVDDTFRTVFAQVPSVTVHGPYEAHRRAEILGSADVLLIASPVESFCFVAREALALAVPVVTSDGGALTEAVRDGVDGLTFRAGDVEDLVRVLARLDGDEDLRLHLADAAPRMVAISEDARGWRQTYGELAPSREPRPATSSRLAVVVASLPGDPTLTATLEALARQDCDSAAFEVLVVDAPPGGSPAAWARGLAGTTSELLVVVDAGDLPGRGFVRSHLEGHARHPAAGDAVVGWAALDVEALNDAAARVALRTDPSLIDGGEHVLDAAVPDLAVPPRLGSLHRDLLRRALAEGVPADAPELALRLRGEGLRAWFHPGARRTVSLTATDPRADGAAAWRTLAGRSDEVVAIELSLDHLSARWAGAEGGLPTARAHADQLRELPLPHLRASSATLPDGRTVPASDVLLDAFEALAEYERLQGAVQAAAEVDRGETVRAG